MTPATELASRTWHELVGTEPTIVVPIGAVEQHGPHLPLDTDHRIAVAVAREAVAALGDSSNVLLAPAIPYGASGEHEGFPGTVSIGREALELVVLEYGRSAMRWAGRLLFVNAHGGNGQALATAVARLRYEGRDAAFFPCAFPGADAHAGHTETSVMLSLAPDDVRRSLAAAGNTSPIAALLGPLREGGVAAVSPNGVLGDATAADPDHGTELLAGLADRLAVGLRDWNVDEAGRLR
ncbi:mycofactocin biosynthesis peptidyl-dipeptidase MftE [Gordonia neofelifaecis]|uniref:Creatininase n=1 Tax=Gordonia neofelifaecis NRRL B-59395 TaxID=644548 RepID=F1YNU3_9ACTN|nr:mycofactocin biosynthesis peptidyl-dipeptidase MftE [Gordonia neofelifaecis]EGD53562.1 Creatininase [Gordonia neofelifaecis NRRL B-59395]